MNLARQMKADGLLAERQRRIRQRDTRASASAAFDRPGGLIRTPADRAPRGGTDDEEQQMDRKPTDPTPMEDLRALANDAFAGQGGSYEVVDGVRRLVARTEDPRALVAAPEAAASEPVPPLSGAA